MFDLCVVGGGIVGLATAFNYIERYPDSGVLLIEKEKALAQHQTSHNSGVIHAGVYYAAGSLKARLCKAGEAATKSFCEEFGVAYRTPGKLIVATDDLELGRLDKLKENARRNDIEFESVDAVELRHREPSIVGKAAMFIPRTGIVDYPGMCQAMGKAIDTLGGTIVLDSNVEHIHEEQGKVRILTTRSEYTARKVVVCGGLQSDRLARRSGLKPDFRIVPFKGEYFTLRSARSDIVERLIYPVPNPALPFLGIHLTPMIDGSITVGPNAVLSLARERYGKFSVDLRDVAGFMAFPGFWRLIAENWRTGLAELGDSVVKARYLEKCRKYCPSLTLDDLVPRISGIRAQAVDAQGKLIHDFLLLQTDHVLHVCNAPSPAATSALPIGRMIVDKLMDKAA